MFNTKNLKVLSKNFMKNKMILKQPNFIKKNQQPKDISEISNG